jgi:hypothetical protein
MPGLDKREIWGTRQDCHRDLPSLFEEVCYVMQPSSQLSPWPIGRVGQPRSSFAPPLTSYA